MPLWTTSLSRTIPLTSCVSDIEPPDFFSTFTLSRSTEYSPSFFSAMPTTALTTSLDRGSASSEMSFDCMLVRATFRSDSSSVGGTSLASSASTSSDLSAAAWYPSTMTDECTSFLSSFSAFSSRAPPNTTDEVVPSPTSLSMVFEISTIILAAGCWTSISFSMVAPSLVMVTSPSESTSILSRPRGPRLVRTRSATRRAAAMLLFCASRPFCCSALSFRTSTGPCGVCWIDAMFRAAQRALY